MAEETQLQHRLNCKMPDVQIVRGLTKTLHTCRSCGAEIFVLKPTTR